MGTWRWDLRTGRVVWDARLEALYGLASGTFDGQFETYAALLHPDDRERTLAAVRKGMDDGTPWRFDHRIVWNDGSTHWLEGRGEPVRDANGVITGATGVSINIDARQRAEAERAELLDGERGARQQAERSTRLLRRFSELTLGLSGAATVDEVAVTIVHHGLQALDGDYGWFGSLDSANNMLVTRAFEGYPPGVMDPFMAISLDETLPATEVLRTGKPVFVESAADRVQRFPQYHGMDVHGSFVVVPVAAFEETPGVLSFGFLEPREFTDDDRRYIAAVVEACAQALGRASLLEAEQRSRARLRTLLDFSEQLAAIDDPEAVLARNRALRGHAHRPLRDRARARVERHAAPGRDRARRQLVAAGAPGPRRSRSRRPRRDHESGRHRARRNLRRAPRGARSRGTSARKGRRSGRTARPAAARVRHRRRAEHLGADARRRAHR